MVTDTGHCKLTFGKEKTRDVIYLSWFRLEGGGRKAILYRAEVGKTKDDSDIPGSYYFSRYKLR